MKYTPQYALIQVVSYPAPTSEKMADAAPYKMAAGSGAGYETMQQATLAPLGACLGSDLEKSCNDAKLLMLSNLRDSS